MGYKYRLDGYRLGGEHTIGLLEPEVGKFWCKYSQEEFEEYMFSDPYDERKDLDKKWKIPKKFQIDEYWHDLDAIDHLCSVEYEGSNSFIVTDLETDEEVATIDMESIPIKETINPFLRGMVKNEHKGKFVVYGQSFEKGSFSFQEIETDKPFDKSLLQVVLVEWDTLKFVESIVYDGEEYANEDGDTIGKEMNMWIEGMQKA